MAVIAAATAAAQIDTPRSRLATGPGQNHLRQPGRRCQVKAFTTRPACGKRAQCGADGAGLHHQNEPRKSLQNQRSSKTFFFADFAKAKGKIKITAKVKVKAKVAFFFMPPF